MELPEIWSRSYKDADAWVIVNNGMDLSVMQ